MGTVTDVEHLCVLTHGKNPYMAFPCPVVIVQVEFQGKHANKAWCVCRVVSPDGKLGGKHIVKNWKADEELVREVGE